MALHDTRFVHIPPILWLDGLELRLAKDLEPLRDILASSAGDSTILHSACPLGPNGWIPANKGCSPVFSKLVGASREVEDTLRNMPYLRVSKRVAEGLHFLDKLGQTVLLDLGKGLISLEGFCSWSGVV